jgi:hypothetical protein
MLHALLYPDLSNLDAPPLAADEHAVNKDLAGPGKYPIEACNETLSSYNHLVLRPSVLIAEVDWLNQTKHVH